MRCICDNKEFIPCVTGKYGKISFIISKCTRCGLRATTQPKLNIETPDYESGELYSLNKKVEIGASTRHNSSLATISKVVKRFFNDKEIEVLDFGCSRGEMARYILLDNYLNEKISKIKGIDLSLKHTWADDKITLKRPDLFDVYEKYDLIY